MRDSSWRAFVRVWMSDASRGLEERIELISWSWSSLDCFIQSINYQRCMASRGGDESVHSW